jgi:hypothetical protein
MDPGRRSSSRCRRPRSLIRRQVLSALAWLEDLPRDAAILICGDLFVYDDR